MYKIILYNKGKRVRIFDKSKSYSDIVKNYNTILEENQVFFPKKFLWNGSETDYELVLTAPSKNSGKEYFRNELGAKIKIKTKGNFVIKKINKYQLEEVFKDKLNDKKITFKNLIKSLIKNYEMTPIIYTLNNKVFIEYFDKDDVELYILKRCSDAYRLLETIKSFALVNGLVNIMYFQNPNSENKGRIYNLLESKFNISKDYMYKISTR